MSAENAAEDNEDIPLIEAKQPGVSDESEQPTEPVNGQLARDDKIGVPDEAEIQHIRKSTSKDSEVFVNDYQSVLSDELEDPTDPVNGQLARDKEIGVPDDAEIQEIRKSKERKVFINGHESVMSEVELDSEDDGKYELLKPMEDVAPNG